MSHFDLFRAAAAAVFAGIAIYQAHFKKDMKQATYSMAWAIFAAV